jgi:hypothetical protein
MSAPRELQLTALGLTNAWTTSVVAPGIQCDWDRVSGLDEALQTPDVLQQLPARPRAQDMGHAAILPRRRRESDQRAVQRIKEDFHLASETRAPLDAFRF